MGKGKKKIEPEDIAIGVKLQEARGLAKLSRLQVARAIGMSHQQIHKYEQGLDRISAGKLSKLAKIVHQPIAFFFEAGA